MQKYLITLHGVLTPLSRDAKGFIDYALCPGCGVNFNPKTVCTKRWVPLLMKHGMRCSQCLLNDGLYAPPYQEWVWAGVDEFGNNKFVHMEMTELQKRKAELVKKNV